MADRDIDSTSAGKAKPKANGASRASKPRKSATEPKPPPIEGAAPADPGSHERAIGNPA